MTPLLPPALADGTRRERCNSLVKVLECDPVFRVGSLQQCLEHSKVVPANEPAARCVCHAKQDSKGLSVDAAEVALRCDGIDERVAVEVPMRMM